MMGWLWMALTIWFVLIVGAAFAVAFDRIDKLEKK
jgi:hypothetical protein